MALDYTAMTQSGYGVPNYDSTFMASPQTLVPTTALPYSQPVSIGPEASSGLTALAGLADILKQAEGSAQRVPSVASAGLGKVKGVGAVNAPQAVASIDPATYKALASLLQGGFK